MYCAKYRAFLSAAYGPSLRTSTLVEGRADTGKGHKKRDEKRDVYRTQKSTVSRAIHVNNEIPPIRKVRHVSSKESNVTGVIFDSFSCHMAGDLIIFP